ncbi:MAG TPA: maleylpyruvate isomerase family mycothiol-dependent enzyme [Nocardioides sp.]|nr:maleylpyruvate isomerase family mycothiol-dependent enzyme [Nocardioides sp.]
MSAPEPYSSYIDAWWQSIADLTSLLDDLPAEQWSTETDLPGWTVHDVVAHTAHLEHVAAGGSHDDVDGIEVGAPDHVRSPMSVFTEQGVIGRRDVAPAELVASIRRDTAVRREQLAELDIDPSVPADGLFGAIGWTWATLLRNRPLDVWMHEQDVRRAVGRPGGMDSAGAQHTADYLSEAFGFIVGKKVGAAPGTTAVLAVEGSPVVAVEVDESGRGRRVAEEPASPTVRLAMGREAFVVAAGGRRPVDPAAVTVEGDAELAQQILAKLATTP